MNVFQKTNRGLILIKTKVYVLFGTFNDRMNPAIAIEAVEKLGRYIYKLSIKYKNLILIFFFLGDYFKAKEQ